MIRYSLVLLMLLVSACALPYAATPTSEPSSPWKDLEWGWDKAWATPVSKNATMRAFRMNTINISGQCIYPGPRIAG